MKLEYDLYPEDLPTSCIEECSASGEVEESVTYWRNQLNFEVNPDKARKYLQSTGGWNKEELAELNGPELALKVLWLACCDFKEGQDIFVLEG